VFEAIKDLFNMNSDIDNQQPQPELDRQDMLRNSGVRNSIHRSGGQFQQRDNGSGGAYGRHSILLDAQVELTRVNKGHPDNSRNEGMINLPYQDTKKDMNMKLVKRTSTGIQKLASSGLKRASIMDLDQQFSQQISSFTGYKARSSNRQIELTQYPLIQTKLAQQQTDLLTLGVFIDKHERLNINCMVD
jgi:hypothetical protein